MKLTVATLALCNALAPAPQRPPQTRRALLAKSGIAALSLAGPLVALPEAANAGRLQDMAAAREAKKGGGKKAAAAPKARRPRQKIKRYEDAVARSMASSIQNVTTRIHAGAQGGQQEAGADARGADARGAGGPPRPRRGHHGTPKNGAAPRERARALEASRAATDARIPVETAA